VYTGVVSYEALIRPDGLGATIIRDFANPEEIAAVLAESKNPEKVDWHDSHDTYENQRGLTIVQNHYSYALKLSAGDQTPFDAIPSTVALCRRTQRFINSLSPIFPSLADWQPDELSLHLYDDQDVGLSKHRDTLRFTGLIAIIAIDGTCDLAITHNDEEIPILIEPGDLSLLRAPGLIDCDTEVRPEHSVQNLRTPTRLSMMLRANNRPTEAIKGFHFNNWHP